MNLIKVLFAVKAFLYLFIGDESFLHHIKNYEKQKKLAIDQFFFFHHFSYYFDGLQEKYDFIFLMKINKVNFVSLFLIHFFVSKLTQLHYLLSLGNRTLTSLSCKVLTFIVRLCEKISRFDSPKFVLIICMEILVFEKRVLKKFLPIDSLVLIDYKYLLQ